MLPSEVQRELLYRASSATAPHHTVTSFYRDTAATAPDRSLPFPLSPGDTRCAGYTSLFFNQTVSSAVDM